MIRYYGTYSNVSRGKRKKEEHKKDVIGKPEFVEVPPPLVPKELKKRWSYFIQKVYETDPLVCPKCQGEMRTISFIDQPEVIKKILRHLGLWEESHRPTDRAPSQKRDPFPSWMLTLALHLRRSTLGRRFLI